ncbi:T9SS type A sorting domain-containing protein [bacterium]|nr:T9SS type A sorting domain-containing protein [bacterium]
MKPLITLCLSLFCITALAQPSNNICEDAILLTYTGSCNFQTYSNTNATSSGSATSTCSSNPSTDVWFKVVVPNSGRLVFQSEYINVRTSLALFTGDCGNLTQYRCDLNSSTEYLMPYIFMEDPSLAGDTLYIQYWGDNASEGDFKFCIFEPDQPTYHNCENAELISVETACTTRYFTTAFAGNSGVPTPPCGNYILHDAWLKVVVPVSGNLILETGNNGIGNSAMALYKGTCSNLSYFDCNDNGAQAFQQARFYIRDSSLAGDTLFVRVWRVGSIYGGGFSFCAFEPDIDPNENPEGAFFIPTLSVCSYSTFDNLYYNNSGSANPPCGNYAGADAWFKTRVPASGKLVITTRNAGLGNLAISTYTKNADTLVYYECDDNHSPNFQQPEIVINDPNLAGDTLYIMAWAVGTIFGGSFDICLFEPDIPVNDRCETAQEIEVKPSCNYERFSNEYAGTSGGGNPSCGNYSGTDIWLKFEAPPSGEFTISSRAAGVNNNAMALYTGTCGSLSEYACDNDNGPGNMAEIAVQDSSLGGQTMYLQVWVNNSVNGGSMDLCIFGKLIPEVRNPSDITICEGEDIPVLSVSKGVFQYNWYDQESGGNLLASDTNRYRPIAGGSFYVSATHPETSEVSERVEVSLTINPKPILVGLQDISYCDNESTKSIGVKDQGDYYIWYTDSMGSSIFDLDTNLIWPSISGSYYIQAIDLNTQCKSDIVEVKAEILRAPVIADAQNEAICENELPYTLNIQDEGYNYRWYDEIDGKLLRNNSASYDANEEGSYFIRAVDPNTGCFSDYDSIHLTINDNPLIINPRGYEDCDDLNYTGLRVEDEGFVYNWYGSSNGGPLYATDKAVYNASINGTYYVEAENETTGCKSVEREAVTLAIYDVQTAQIYWDGDSLHTDSAIFYQWYKDDLAIFGANEISFDAVESGDYYVIIMDKNGCESQSNTVTLSLTNGVLNESEIAFNLYPNPAENYTNLELKQNMIGANVTILDIQGKVIQSLTALNNKQRIELSKLQTGLYYIKVERDSQIYTQRIVKQ